MDNTIIQGLHLTFVTIICVCFYLLCRDHQKDLAKQKQENDIRTSKLIKYTQKLMNDRHAEQLAIQKAKFEEEIEATLTKYKQDFDDEIIKALANQKAEFDIELSKTIATYEKKEKKE